MYNISSITNTITLALLHLPDYAAITGLSLKREIEKSGTAFLLKKLLGQPIELAYTNEGKPFLVNAGGNISISHSHDKLAIILDSGKATGIDIELIRDKVLKIKQKFLSTKELLDAGDDVQKLITYWACKEVLYKLYSLKEVDFIEKFYVHPFEKKDSGVLIAEILIDSFRKKVKLHYEKIEDYMLVYSLDEIG